MRCCTDLAVVYLRYCRTPATKTARPLLTLNSITLATAGPQSPNFRSASDPTSAKVAPCAMPSRVLHLNMLHIGKESMHARHVGHLALSRCVAIDEILSSVEMVALKERRVIFAFVEDLIYFCRGCIYMEETYQREANIISCHDISFFLNSLARCVPSPTLNQQHCKSHYDRQPTKHNLRD